MTKGSVFFLDENSTSVATLTYSAFFSLFTPTVTIANISIAGFNAAAVITSQGVATFLVFIRADCEVLTLIYINTFHIILSQLESFLTADMAAHSVEAGLILGTDRPC